MPELGELPLCQSASTQPCLGMNPTPAPWRGSGCRLFTQAVAAFAADMLLRAQQLLGSAFPAERTRGDPLGLARGVAFLQPPV